MHARVAAAAHISTRLVAVARKVGISCARLFLSSLMLFRLGARAARLPGMDPVSWLCPSQLQDQTRSTRSPHFLIMKQGGGLPTIPHPCCLLESTPAFVMSLLQLTTAA